VRGNSFASQTGKAIPPSTLGGSSGWTQVIDEDGTSFSDFTSIAGSWTSDGVKIIQSNTGGGPFAARHNTKVVCANLIVECEVQYPTTGQAAAPNYIGIYPGVSSGATTGTPSLFVRREAVAADSHLSMRPDNVVPTVTLGATIAVDVWYKVRIVVSGSRASLYLDGVLLGTISYAEIPSGNSLDITYAGLVTSAALAWFRNFKVWTLEEPS
jgi:hypothetical protein